MDSTKHLSHPPQLDLATLKPISIAGRGAKGVVFLVRSGSGELLALKAISRKTLDNKKKTDGSKDDDPYHRIWFERDVLSSLRHPLLPSLRGFVTTDKIIGLAMDWCPGGNLSSLRRRQTEQMFSNEQIRFYAAELVLALEHLHEQRIVYRDLKPENVLIQESGHIMLVDFDLSVRLPEPGPAPDKAPNPNPNPDPKRRGRLLSCFSSNSGVSPEMSVSARNSPETSGKSNSFVGTEEYVSPEVIRGTGHDYGVDWWGLGVVLYEMLYGRTPFRGQNRKETFYRIVAKEPEMTGEKTALRDLIRRLLEKEAEARIGVEGIKRHEFFRGVDWERVLTVERTPFVPGGVEWEEGEGVDVEECVEEMFWGKEGLRKYSKGDGDFEVF